MIREDFILFILKIIVYISIWNVIEIIVSKINILNNNKLILYLTLIFGGTYILIYKYNYVFK